jgi:hypothetical protein
MLVRLGGRNCSLSCILKTSVHLTCIMKDNKSWRLRRWMKCWASVLALTVGRTLEGRVVSSMRRPHFTWYSFLLAAVSTPGLLNVDKRIKSLEKFQRPHRESNQGISVLWKSTSTNRASPRPYPAL